LLKPYDVEQAAAESPLSSSSVTKQPRKPKVKKLFVLDTNVLMHDPTSLFRFEEHDVYLPMGTLEELDGNKKGLSDVSRNARQASRFLDEIVSSEKASIQEGLQIKVKQKDYQRNKLASKESLKGIAPGKNSLKAAEYGGHLKIWWAYKHNPHSDDQALKGIKPTSSFIKGNAYAGGMKMKKYVHNPNSNKLPSTQIFLILLYLIRWNEEHSNISGQVLSPTAVWLLNVFIWTIIILKMINQLLQWVEAVLA